MFKRSIALSFIACLVAVPIQAGNGHYLHGVGAINSSLGGAGTGIPFDIIGALHANPALLTEFDGIHVALSAEAFVDDLSITTEFPGFNNGNPHTTESDGELGVLPALGWSLKKEDSKVTFGWGLLAVAGFRTNFPGDENSALLSAQPNGFGRLQTELSVAKIPFAFGWKVNDKLSLGAALDLFQSRLNIQPLPVVVPDCDPAVPPLQNEDCYRPGVSIPVGEWAFGVQLGLYYKINSQWSFGLSYTSEQDYDDFVWQSAHANPNLANFGTRRDISIALDQPAIASFGLGFHKNKVKVAFDLRWVGYNSQDGIGGSGGIDDQQRLISIGWDDIMIAMLGVEIEAGPKLRYRFGLNFNESPIQDQLTLNSGGTPSVFEEHYTVGLSYAVTPNFDLNLGGYYTPSNSKTGPFQGAATEVGGIGPFLPGTSITLTNEILSALVGVSFHF